MAGKNALQLSMCTDMATESLPINAVRERQGAAALPWAAWNLTAITLLVRCFCSKCSR